METTFLKSKRMKQIFYILEIYITLPSSCCGEITMIVMLRAITHTHTLYFTGVVRTVLGSKHILAVGGLRFGLKVEVRSGLRFGLG